MLLVQYLKWESSQIYKYSSNLIRLEHCLRSRYALDYWYQNQELVIWPFISRFVSSHQQYRCQQY